MRKLRVLWLSGLRGAPECFLHNHPGLLHLRIPDYHMPLQLAPSDLPALASFRGSPVAAASLLPGRPVQSLALVGYEFVGEAALVALGTTSVPVAALDLTGMSVTPTLLRDIARALPAIRALRVRLALRHTLHYALSGIVSGLLIDTHIARLNGTIIALTSGTDTRPWCISRVAVPRLIADELGRPGHYEQL